MTPKCGGAAKNSEWGLGLLELESGPWKEEEGMVLSLCPPGSGSAGTYILEKEVEKLGLVQQQVTRMGRKGGLQSL